MIIKYRQKKPKILEELLKKQVTDQKDIRKCPYCNKFYDANKFKEICPKCFRLLTEEELNKMF